MAQELMNPEAENLVLAGILQSPANYWDINGCGLLPEDFVGAEARRVMRGIAGVAAAKHDPSLPLVLEQLRLSDRDSTVEYATKLNGISCSPSKAKEYALTVKGLAVSRRLQSVGARIIEVAAESRSDYEAAISEAESELRKVRNILPADEHSADAGDIIARMRNRGPEDSIPIRFSPTLQDIVGGYRRGHIWVMGGFSSTGKSAVAAQMLLDALRSRDVGVAVFSNEMTQEQYITRMLANISQIPQRVLRERVTLPFEHMGDLKKAEQWLAHRKLTIYDIGNNKLTNIRSKALRLKETSGLDIMLVDYLNNINITGDEVQDVRIAAQELQELAKVLNCTVIAVSQVSNEMAKRQFEGADRNYYAFRGNGAIKDVADVAVMLKRDRYKAPRTMQFDIVKHRHGEMRTLEFDFDLLTGRMTELDYDEEAEASNAA